MIRINKKIKSTILLLVVGSVLPSCYEKFDSESYSPAFTISGYTAVDEIEPASLVAYFPLDGDLIEGVSSSAGTNSGATFVNGFKGMALKVDVAEKSYATFNPSSSITGAGSFTLSFWVNPTFVDANGNGEIDGILGLVNLSNPTGFWGNIDWFVENGSKPESSKIVVHVTNSTGEQWMNVSNYANLFDRWTNHTLTYDAGTSTFKYYINGSVGTSGVSSWGGAITFANSGPMVFGCVHFQTTPTLANHGSEPWASYLTGSLDEIRIYNKALSAEDVNALVVLQGKGK